MQVANHHQFIGAGFSLLMMASCGTGGHDPDSSVLAFPTTTHSPTTSSVAPLLPDPSTPEGRATAILDPTFDDVATLRVINFCQCIVHIDAHGSWNTGTSSQAELDVNPDELDFAVEVVAPATADSVDFVVTVTFDDDQQVVYPLQGKPLRAIRAKALLEFTINADAFAEPLQITNLLTAPIPQVMGDLDPATRSDGLGWYIPPIDGESYGPHVVAVTPEAIYIGDPVNSRVSVMDTKGHLSHTNLDLDPTDLLGLQAMAVDSAARVIYLDLNDSLLAVELDGNATRWSVPIAGMWPESLITHDGVTTIRIGSECYLVDPLTGPVLDQPSTRGLCVIDDVRDGHARVLIQVDGMAFASLVVDSKLYVPITVLVHSVDADSHTVYGAISLREGMEGRVSLSFAASPGGITLVSTPVSTDGRFHRPLPVTTERGAIGLRFADGIVHLMQVSLP